MSEKIKLLKLASQKATNDSGFIAYLINKYLEIESISEQEIQSTLHCSGEDYYKLNLCRVPDINADDYLLRLTKICQYTNSSIDELNKVIKRANSVLRFTASDIEQHNFLVAAREKLNKDQN
jgi:hypothetical protein